MKSVARFTRSLAALACHARGRARLAPTAEALAGAMRGAGGDPRRDPRQRIQHALRAASLRKLVEAGARPVIAFEQFDSGVQDAIDPARRGRACDVDHLIAQARARRAGGGRYTRHSSRSRSSTTCRSWRRTSLARSDAGERRRRQGGSARRALLRAQESAGPGAIATCCPRTCCQAWRARRSRGTGRLRGDRTICGEAACAAHGQRTRAKGHGVPHGSRDPRKSIALLEADGAPPGSITTS